MAGPPCNVSTTNEATSRWLTEALLKYKEVGLNDDASRDPWWSLPAKQSENGILLKVGTGNEEQHGIQNVITELLFYATVVNTSPELPTLPAPSPAFPDEDLEDALDHSGMTIEVLALPLCSNVIGLVNNSMNSCPSAPTGCPSARQACFLPYIHDQARITEYASQKRQSISTLFEDATQKKRKLKGRGGERVSQTMASIEPLPSHCGMREKQEAPQPQQNHPRRRSSLSRVSSMTSVCVPEQSQAPSHSGSLANGKRSSLHRVQSVISPCDTPTLPDADGSYEQQNKAALTKVLMAAMRLHGLQQKKKQPSLSQLPDKVMVHTTGNTVSSEAEDEYKLVYHQAFKAALFMFRKHLNALLISQETMRDVVDRLLTMFCMDPMVVDQATRISEFPELDVDKGVPSSSPFDKPSCRARSSNIAHGWNTPTRKKCRI